MDYSSDTPQPNSASLELPPQGVQVDRCGNNVIVTSTTRSFKTAMLTAMVLLWDAGFIFMAVTTILKLRSGEQETNAALYIFPPIFLCATLGLNALCIASLFGTIRITLTGDSLVVFTGIGGLGYTRRAPRRHIDAIRYVEEIRGSSHGNTTVQFIQFDGPKPVRAGLFLSCRRAEYIVAIIQGHLQQNGAASRPTR